MLDYTTVTKAEISYQELLNIKPENEKMLSSSMPCLRFALRLFCLSVKADSCSFAKKKSFVMCAYT